MINIWPYGNLYVYLKIVTNNSPKTFKNMLKFIQFLSLIIIFTLTVNSCKKEVIEKPDNTNYVLDGEHTVEGVTWILVDAKIYRDSEDGNKDVFDHFGGTKWSSCLNMYGSSTVLMDSIHRDLTRWEFNNGTFILDGVHQFDYTTYDNRIYTPIGLNGGTARPIELVRINDINMTVKVYEVSGSDGVTNYNWYSELTFVKAGEVCVNCVSDVKFGYTYGGVWQNTTTNTMTMVGTKWIVRRYNNGLSGNVYPNDTLSFTSTTQYTINSGSVRVYSLSNVVGNNNKSLSLYSLTTLGGDYSGQVIGSFIDDWEINNTQMTDMFNVNNTVTIWMERIL